MLLKGPIRLRFEERESPERRLKACVNVPAHGRHRAGWIGPGQPTLWLTGVMEI